MSAATPSDFGPVQFFAYGNGNGFAKFEPVSKHHGDLWVMGKLETEWVLAGCESKGWIKEAVASGMIYEFSPARLLGSSRSAAKVRASQLNGAKGGRPRKAV